MPSHRSETSGRDSGTAVSPKIFQETLKAGRPFVSVEMPSKSARYSFAVGRLDRNQPGNESARNNSSSVELAMRISPRRFLLVLTTLCLVHNNVIASDAKVTPSFGTPEEARAMLDRAVKAVRDNKAKALEMFNRGSAGFRDRDLQPFCFERSTGKIVASLQPTLLGIDARTLRDKKGRMFGADIVAAARVGELATVSYFFPRPGETKPIRKTSYVTGVLDLGCGVGYYE